jgi:hypothetical protein
MSKLHNRRPSAAMVVAVIALIAALAGTAYAAHAINGALIKRGTITGAKLKKKTLNANQINTNKLGVVPKAKVATHTYWAVVHNPGGANNAALTRASTGGISVTESGGAVNVIFPANVSVCADVAGRNNDGTNNPEAGYAQTNVSPANANALVVHTRDKNGNDVDGDFHVIVVCP